MKLDDFTTFPIEINEILKLWRTIESSPIATCGIKNDICRWSIVSVIKVDLVYGGKELR